MSYELERSSQNSRNTDKEKIAQARDKAIYDPPPGVSSRTDHHSWKTKEMEKDRQGGEGKRKRKRRKKIKQKHLLPKGLKSRVPCTQSIKGWYLFQQVKLKIFTVFGTLRVPGKSYLSKGE